MHSLESRNPVKQQTRKGFPPVTRPGQGFLRSLSVASLYAMISRRRRQKKGAVLRFTPQDWQWFLLSILTQNAQSNGLVYTDLKRLFSYTAHDNPFFELSGPTPNTNPPNLSATRHKPVKRGHFSFAKRGHYCFGLKGTFKLWVDTQHEAFARKMPNKNKSENSHIHEEISLNIMFFWSF